MKPSFDFTAQKRDSGYLFVAKQYGVVVWAKDPVVGIQELESRVENVAAQFREAGVDVSQKMNGSSGQSSSFVKMVIVAIFVLGAVALPFSLIYKRVVSFVATIEHPITSLIQLADKVDEVSPAQMDALKLAVRRIATKVAPLVEEAKMVTTTERQSDPPVEKGQPKSR